MASNEKSNSSSSTSSSGLAFKLHPLVILNISDHYTRVRSQHPFQELSSSSSSTQQLPRVLGCVLGVQIGRTVEIFNSFELTYDVIKRDYENLSTFDHHKLDPLHNLDIVIDRDFLKLKMEQYKKVFPKFDVLGWYSTGSDISPSDLNIHKTLMDVNESPILVLLDPFVEAAAKDLPITIYESEIHVIDSAPSMIFVKSNYTIQTVEAERISVDLISHIQSSPTDCEDATSSSQLSSHLTGMQSAVRMLHVRIKMLSEYLQGVKNGTFPYDHSLLRLVSSLVQRLPLRAEGGSERKFQSQFMTDYNDTLLTAYLATLTNGSSALNDFVDKFNVAFDRHSRRLGKSPFPY